MTTEEAIEILMHDEKLAEIEYYGGFEGKKKVAKLYSEAFDMAISALEKQMPKKPYIQQDNMNNDCIECSSCDSFIGYECDCKDEHYQINYCPCCGQAIDWSEK